MKFLTRILATFDYHSWLEFGQSLLPSSKYNLTLNLAPFTVLLFPAIDRLFGLDAVAFGVLLVVFVAELSSGIYASKIMKVPFSSMKLSRFSFKVAYYLVLISLPYVMAVSFKAHDKTAAATMFDWLHLFLVAQIVLENVVSILENLAVISGKPKTHWITAIKEKIKNLIA